MEKCDNQKARHGVNCEPLHAYTRGKTGGSLPHAEEEAATQQGGVRDSRPRHGKAWGGNRTRRLKKDVKNEKLGGGGSEGASIRLFAFER